MKNVEIKEVVRVHIKNDYEQCVAFYKYILKDPEGKKLLEFSIPGSHSGLGNLIHLYEIEARPLLEKFFNEYEKKVVNELV